MIRKVAKKLNALILVACIIVLQFTLSVSAVEYPAFAKIKQSKGVGYTPVRTLPGLNSNPQSSTIENIYDNEIVKVIAEANDPDGDMWYQIQYGSSFEKQGYVFNTHVIFMGNYVEDPVFEESIKDFPESYKVKLRNLHSIYPNWKFKADFVGRTWEEVIAAESTPGKKLVHYTKPDSWKSNDPETMNPDGSWKWYDSGGWVAASKMVIEYYMDPRNMLESGTVFMFVQHNYDETQDTEDKLQKILKGTFMEGALQDDSSKTYSSVLMAAATQYKVSPLVMAAKFIQEQGAQGVGGNIAGNITGFENLYNYFNVGAYADSKLGYDAVQRGLWWAAGAGSGNTSYGRPWNTREKSILGGAQWYAENYVGGYQNTYYYMNFDVKGNYSHQYATNIEDSAGKASGLAKGFSGAEDLEIIFSIPVYENMPEYTTLPAENTNNNNYLKLLQISNCEIGFDKYDQEYEVIVPYSVSSVNVTAVPDYAGAIVTGTGVRQLNVGHNEIEIKVVATSGETRKYVIHISRSSSTDVSVSKPSFNTSYKTGDYLTGVNFETDVNTFINNLGVSNGTAKVFASSGEQKTGGAIATGDVVKIFDNANSLAATHTVVIYGDTSGDGKITARDLLIGQRHILKLQQLEGAYQKAVDINKDGSIKARDLLVGQRHILRLQTIIQ